MEAAFEEIRKSAWFHQINLFPLSRHRNLDKYQPKLKLIKATIRHYAIINDKENNPEVITAEYDYTFALSKYLNGLSSWMNNTRVKKERRECDPVSPRVQKLFDQYDLLLK